MSYLHNIVTDRNTSITVDPQKATFGVQLAIGTAPVNLNEDPAKAVNVPIIAKTLAEAKALLGFSADTIKYTLMQTIVSSFQKFAVAPVVFINVLDPAKEAHKTAVTGAEFTITGGKAKISVEGILLSTVVVKYGEDYASTAAVDTDYVLAFDEDGFVDLAVTGTGALANVNTVQISYAKLNPAGVTPADIIGGISAAGVRTGIELADEVYSRYGIIPSILTAPGFSSNPSVAAALEAKAELMGDLVSGIAIVDLPAGNTTNYTTVQAAKETLGVSSRWVTVCYPNVLVGARVFCMSAIVAAQLQNLCIQGDNIPSESPDNKELPIDGACYSDGTEVFWTQNQINDYINKYGVLSAIRLGEWKAWGNNTSAYPGTKNPNDRFIKNVMMSNYLENRFKTEYLPSIGRNGSTKEMDSIVTNYNADLNALVPDHLAGAYVVFNKDDNPMSEILEGRWHFRTHYADYIPTEYIENLFTWDSSILENTIYTEGE